MFRSSSFPKLTAGSAELGRAEAEMDRGREPRVERSSSRFS